MRAALDARDPSPLLLYGVTGSGKTEVFLQSIAHCLAEGRSAIVLVPEIALAPQTAARVAARFGARVAMLHSALGAGERAAEYGRIARGEAPVVVGPRSAVFAPVHDLGLVVVDEEHESAYKQDSDPRYDARALAVLRARATGAACVVASATPRPGVVARARATDAAAARRRRAAAGRGRRPAARRRLSALAAAARRPRGDRARRRARDPAPEPPRRGARAPLPRLRPRLPLHGLRRLADAPPRRPARLPPLRRIPTARRSAARTAAPSTSPGSAPAPSGSRR